MYRLFYILIDIMTIGKMSSELLAPPDIPSDDASKKSQTGATI